MKTGVLTIHPGSLLARLAGICSMMCDELAPFPGRSQTTWRYVVACATVILIAQTLQVHFLAISLIVVFFTLQENTVLTRLSGVRAFAFLALLGCAHPVVCTCVCNSAPC